MLLWTTTTATTALPLHRCLISLLPSSIPSELLPTSFSHSTTVYYPYISIETLFYYKKGTESKRSNWGSRKSFSKSFIFLLRYDPASSAFLRLCISTGGGSSSSCSLPPSTHSSRCVGCKWRQGKGGRRRRRARVSISFFLVSSIPTGCTYTTPTVVLAAPPVVYCSV